MTSRVCDETDPNRPRGIPYRGDVEAAVLVPIKAFGAAKLRLAEHLDPDARRRLAQAMAERVLAASAPLPTFVACDDDEVAHWAESRGAEVLWGPGLGLNGAIDHGVATVAGKGADHVVVTHADLPLADDFAPLLQPGRVVLVPDTVRDGTNVMARPCSVDLPAAYGAGSFRRHVAGALASGRPVSVRRDPRLSVDVDTIEDCRHPLVADFVRAATGVTP